MKSATYITSLLLSTLLTITPVVMADTGLQRLGPHVWGKLAADERSANSAVFVGSEAALVVDPGLTPAIAQAFLNEVQTAIGAIPIRYIVLSHWHPDHALGALCLSDSEAQLIAHPVTADRLQQNIASVITDLANGPVPADEKQALATCRPDFPEHLIENTENFDLGGVNVQVFHPGHGHTAGDLVAWSAADKVLVTGDVFMHSASPDMGESDPNSWVKMLDQLVALHPLHVVAGHFGLSNGSDLLRFRDYMSTLVNQVSLATEQGLTEDAIVNSINMQAFSEFAQYPQYNATFSGNARDIARALKSLATKPEKVVFSSTDALKITAWYQLPARLEANPVAAIIVIHQGGASKDEWINLSLWQDFLKRGYALLAFDIRGHGESDMDTDDLMDLFNNPRRAPLDLKAAIDYLLQDPRIDPDRIGIIGASVGANLAVVAASNEEYAVKSVVSMSAKTMAAQNLSGQSEPLLPRNIFLIASRDEQQGLRRQWASEIFANATGHKKLVIARGDLHGSHILSSMPDLNEQILNWFEETL